jgi:hypothetical protein
MRRLHGSTSPAGARICHEASALGYIMQPVPDSVEHGAQGQIGIVAVLAQPHRQGVVAYLTEQRRPLLVSDRLSLHCPELQGLKQPHGVKGLRDAVPRTPGHLCVANHYMIAALGTSRSDPRRVGLVAVPLVHDLGQALHALPQREQL